MVIMDTILEHTCERIKSAASLVNPGADAVAKSLRAYDTEVHPVIWNQLGFCFPSSMTTVNHHVGRTWAYSTPHLGMSGSVFLNYVLQPFYEQEPRPDQEVDVIPISVSRSTRSESLSEASVRDECCAWARTFLNEETGVANFEDLIIDRIGPAAAQDLLQDPAVGNLSTDILTYVSSNGGRYLAHKPVARGQDARHLTGLSMHTRYYENRDDHRAFCTDADVMRSLSGGMLHRLVFPHRKSVRSRLHYSSVLRCPEKDMLDLSVPAPGPGEVTILIVGDISNFTGSLGNAWLMLFSMMLSISSSPLESRMNLFELDDILIKAKWWHVIAIYLFLTVGAPVWVNERNTNAYLPGGYLGVNANITVGLLFLCVTMQNALDIIRPYVTEAHAQAGGDDHAFMFTCSLASSSYIVTTLRDHMNKYVGRLKEFHVTVLEQPGLVADISFCRKRIYLTRHRGRYAVRGEPTIPLPPDALPSVYLEPYAQVRAFYALTSALGDYRRRYGDELKITDALLASFLDRYPSVKPVIRTYRKIHDGSDLLPIGDRFLTKAAWELVSAIPGLTLGYASVFVSDEAKLRRGLRLGVVTQVKLWSVEGLSFECVHSATEKPPALDTVTKHEEWVTYVVRPATIRTLGL